MYRRPKFLEVLLTIRQEMARESDYDVDLFAEMVRAGRFRQTRISIEPDRESNSNGNSEEVKSKAKKYGNRI